MVDKVDFVVINATYDAISPIIRAHGQSKESVGKFVYYLLVIAAAIADHIGINAEHFRALSANAWDAGKSGPSNNTPAN